MRRPATTAVLALLAVVALAGPVHARPVDDDPKQDELPATYLEADQRDDGNTDAAAWMLGSGVAAVVIIGVGGTVLMRRQRRADQDGPPPA
jgi:hypothetical protein